MAGIYIHIPFCKRRCIYCDFYSTTQFSLINTYVKTVCAELTSRKKELTDEPIETIYFGGGTPSLLSAEQIKIIIDTIYQHYQLASECEVTLEANPDDLTTTYIAQLSTTLVNRLSIGIQTFDDKRLRFLNRRHSAQRAIDAVSECQQAGFGNISIDLIYGFPYETREEWMADIAQAINLGVQHISAYHLIVEEDTPLWVMREEGKLGEEDEEVSLQLFNLLIEQLELHDFHQYEISNFSRPNHHSRHNSSYWNGTKYLGVGASAHSYNGTVRSVNVADLDTYISGVNSGNLVVEVEDLDQTTRYNDLILTSIRTTWGLDLSKLKRLFGEQLYAYCLSQAAVHLKENLLERTESNEKSPLGILKLTRAGIFISDRIMSDLMWVD